MSELVARTFVDLFIIIYLILIIKYYILFIYFYFKNINKDLDIYYCMWNSFSHFLDY